MSASITVVTCGLVPWTGPCVRRSPAERHPVAAAPRGRRLGPAASPAPAPKTSSLGGTTPERRRLPRRCRSSLQVRQHILLGNPATTPVPRTWPRSSYARVRCAPQRGNEPRSAEAGRAIPAQQPREQLPHRIGRRRAKSPASASGSASRARDHRQERAGAHRPSLRYVDLEHAPAAGAGISVSTLSVLTSSSASNSSPSRPRA